MRHEDRRRAIGARFGPAFAYRDYRTLWTANMSASAAAWALIVARGWVVFDMSGSSLLVGLVTFAAMAPRVFVTPFTGYLSDRFDRKKVLAAMFGLNMAHNLLLALLVLTGTAQVWHLVVLSLVNGSARAAQLPAGQALIPNLVPREHLLNAIALNSATQHGSRLAGPAAIAPLLATVGPSGAFFLCTALYGVSTLQALRIGVRSTGRIDRSRSVVGNLAQGLFFVYRSATLRALVVLVLLHCGLTMSFESLLPVISAERLGLHGAGFSYLMMAVGSGALVTTLALAGVRDEATKGRLYLYLGLLSGATPALLALTTSTVGAMLAAAGMGASQAGFMALTHSMVQSLAPDWVRGRVTGVYSIHIGGTMAAANLVNGGLADYVSAPLVLAVGGLLFVLVMVASLQEPVLRSIYVRGLRPEAVAR